MTIHEHPPGTPQPDGRTMFLVDGCDRCIEYANDLGLPFTPERFRAFWSHMIDVEFEEEGGYASALDKKLGSALYKIALSFQRAYGLDVRALRFPHAFTPVTMIVVPGEPDDWTTADWEAS